MMTKQIEAVCEQHKSHLESIEHGKPERLSEAMTDNEFFAQGDLNIGPISQIPEGYKRVEQPTPADRQLVKGETVGSKHCLTSLQGVEIYHPDDWTEESLLGPVLVFRQEGTITHPTHGDVIVPAGMTVQIGYQREYDAEQRRERRSRD